VSALTASPPASSLTSPAPENTGNAVHFVVLDACVLMPTVLRRLLLRCAARGCYAPVWSAYIGIEWMRNAARLWDAPLESLEIEWQALQCQFPAADAGDVGPYETGLKYSDPKDFHVIAAGLAKRARCGLQRTPRVTVMTWNLKDFNRSELKRLGVGVATPDAFLAQSYAAHRREIHEALLLTMADTELVGRPALDLSDALHRERLFRFKNLVTGSRG